MATHVPPEYTLMRTRYLTFTSKFKEQDKKIVKEYEQLIGLLPEEFLKYGTGRTDVKARIAQAKKSTGRTPSRGNSPAVGIPPQPNPFGGGGGGGMFGGGAMQQPQQQQQPAANPFTASSFDFNFGGNQTNGASTNNPFSFGASAPAPSQPQQNGTPNMFGQSAAPSFGTGTATSFGTNASQPQQNGFNPSTSMFNQPSQSQQTNNTGFSFGQNASTQQNGTSTPTTSFGGFGSQAPQSNTNGNVSFSFGGAAQEKQEPKPSTPFAGFGQTPAASNNQPSNLFGNLGQNATQNGDKPSTPFAGFGTQSTQQNGTLFSGNAQEKPKENGQTTSNLFGNIGQQKTPEPEQSNTLFSGIGKKPAESAGGSNDLFGNLGQKPLSSAGNNLFAAASRPEQQTPKPTSSLFSGLSNTQPPKPSTSLFDAPSSSVPASTGKGLFGSQAISNEPSKGTGSVFDNLPPRETPQFGSHIPGQAYKEGDDEEEQQAENGKIELFSKPKAAESAPPSNPFGGFGSTQPASSTSLFKTSSAQQDTSMTTPSGTPQKSLFAPSETPATQPPARSLFDRIEAPAPSATPAPQPAKSLFDRIEEKPDETPKASMFNNASATPATAKPMFSQPAPASEAPSASLFQKPASSAHLQVPPKNIFSQTPAASSTAAVPPAAQSSTNKQPPPPAKHTFKEPGYAGYRPVAAAQGALSESQRASFEKLNDALLVHINKLETNQDLSEIFRFALVASAEIAGRSRPSESELNPAPRAAVPAQAATGSGSFSAASTNATTSSGKQPVQGPGSNTAAPPQTNLFAQTPKAAPATSLFSQPPATAPTKKRSFEEDSDDLAQQPATEKRSKPNEPQQYPKLPATASSTAKLFASTLDKPQEETPKSASTSGLNPSMKSLFSAPTSGSAASKPATAGFTPSFGAQTKTAAPSGFTPAGGATAGSSFLSSFGDAAKAQEEKDRKKRKADDYDSDEETEEQWLKRDKEEQEAKRKKIEEAAKSAKGFTFTASNGPTSPAKQPTAAALEKAQGKGDNTWKPETPIKFSLFNAGDNASTTPAVSPPKLGGGSLFANSAAGKPGGLFSAGSASTDTSSKLAPPSTGFNFSSQPSSLGVSRATTPGVTTDGEASTAAEGEDGDAETSNDPQAEDQTGLTTEERNANDILGEFHDVKTSKFEVNDQGQKKWVPKGFGVVYLLKDKETGKTRILSRVGTGKLTLNYNPLKGSKYAIHPKKDTMVTAAFWDHLHTTEPALGQFIMTTSKANDASELARILTEGTPQ
ncbi:hypothetical protein HII31_09641 [Pseudocercospora fuligena]|uniref:RanBD1 domain-containing protein n=1 Tax=Pseudocercospora fuligena TaxID=685502 RepID=A0A8H6RDE6_9PEZI|nr:hypothetical protein HII31_09641 [Pseudocercospora fuligena]